MKSDKNMISRLALWMGDDALIIGHRLSEWCGHAPILEEDIALANVALDCLGQANSWLKLAAEYGYPNKTEDDLAFFREAGDFTNLQLLEQPNGDFAKTIVRQFLFDAFRILFYEKLFLFADENVAGISGRALKEIKYHFRHSRSWLIRLGDGTPESHMRIIRALEELWEFTNEMFKYDETGTRLASLDLIPGTESLKENWYILISSAFREAGIDIPDQDRYFSTGSRNGMHTEHLGHLLAEMQITARSFPGAKW